MKLQTFNGGLNIRPEPQFIATEQARVYDNIDSTAGSLKPVNLPLDTGQAISRYHTYYNAGAEWVESDEKRDYVEFQKKLYWTDRVSRPQKYDGTNTYNLGLDLPPIFNTAVEAAPAPVNEVKLEVISESDESKGLPADLQYYALIIISADDKQSNALHIGVNDRDSVFTVVESTFDPLIRPIVDNQVEARRNIKFSEFNGVDFKDPDDDEDAGDKVEIYRQYKDKWYFVGEVTEPDTDFTDSVEDISANKELDFEAFSNLQGVYQYVMTYYNSSDGSESGPSELTEEIDVTDGGQISITNIAIPSDPQVDTKRLYRIGGNLIEFTLMAELEVDVTEYVDNRADSDAEREVLIDYASRPAPAGLAFISTAYAMLFGAEDTQLRFTPIGQPDDWPEEYFLDFEAPITGIAPVANGILVFTRYRTHLVTGTGPTSLSQFLLSGDQGCLAHESISYLGTEAIWVSADGVCASSGGLPRVLTKELLGKLNLNPVDSVVYDEMYYVLDSDGSILSLDKGIAKNYHLGVDSLAIGEGKFYGRLNGNLAEMFASDSLAYFKYKSGRLTEGSFTANKTYKKLFTFVDGSVKINIIINDEVVQTKELSGKDSFTIQIPQNKQRGFYIQFEIEGTGTVSELEYKVGT